MASGTKLRPGELAPRFRQGPGSAPRARCADRQWGARQGGGGCVHRQARLPAGGAGAATFVFRGPAHEVRLLSFIHGGSTAARFCRFKVPTSGFCASASRTPAASNTRSPCRTTAARIGLSIRSIRPEPAIRFGENSVCRTSGYARPEWSEPRGAPSGRIEEITVPSLAFGESRTERVYLPAGYDPARTYPLVVVHDGSDFVSYAGLPVVLDNLIAAGDIPPVVAALVQTRDRMGDYADGRRHCPLHRARPPAGARRTLAHRGRGTPSRPRRREPWRRRLTRHCLSLSGAPSAAWR